MKPGGLADELRRLAGDAEALWQRCLPELASEDWQRRKVAVQALARGADLETLIPRLLDAVQDQDNAALRNAALEVLELMGPQVVPALIARLERADAETQKFLVDVLGLIGSPIATPRLATLLNHSDPNIRFAAAEALGELGSPMAAEALFRQLKSSRPSTETFVILQALAQCAEQNAIEAPPVAMLKPLRSDPLLLRPLLHLLSTLDDPAADRFLWSWLSQFDALRLQDVAKFLGTQDPASLAAKVRRHGRPTIRGAGDAVASLLRALDPEVRAGAIWLAIWAGETPRLFDAFRAGQLDAQHLLHAAPIAATDAFAPLVDRWRELHVEAQATLIELVGRLGDRRHGDVLLEIGRTHPSLRPLAFRWGAELGRLDVLEWLVPLLKHPEDAETIAAGLGVLLPTHHQRIVDALMPWSESIALSDEWRTFLVLVERLNLLELRGRVELAWKRADPGVRAAALNVLARFRLDEARHYLGLALNDESEDVRLMACEILADVAQPDNEREVRLLLRDRIPWIRGESLRTLLRLRGAAARSDFLAALRDPADIVRIQAIRALRATADADAAEVVHGLLEHASIDVLAEGLRYFQTIAAPIPATAVRWLDHANWRVRLEAMLWLSRDHRFQSAVRERLYHEDDADVLAVGMKVVA